MGDALALAFEVGGLGLEIGQLRAEGGSVVGVGDDVGYGLLGEIVKVSGQCLGDG